jgi:hypothetical protein
MGVLGHESGIITTSLSGVDLYNTPNTNGGTDMQPIYRDEKLIQGTADFIWARTEGNLTECFHTLEGVRKIYLKMEKGVELYNHLRYTDCVMSELMHKARRAGYFNSEAV